MIQKLSQSSLKLIFTSAFYLVLAIIWSWISLQTNSYESQSGYFEIKALLKFKILLTAAILGGHFLFHQYRLSPTNPWVYPLSLLLVGWSVFDKLVKAENLHYGLLIGADILLWSVMIKDIIAVLSAIFNFWQRLPKVNYAMFSDIWSKLSNDLFKLGVWLTALLGLSFYYLVSFFMVDALLYSYLLIIPLLGIGVALYLMIFYKIKAWVHTDLIQVNEEINSQLNWGQTKDDPELSQKTAWFQYLTLVRNYLKELERPVFLFKSLLLYGVCTAFILSLPYFFGRVIEL